jgi:hypothetical protein
MFVHVKRKAKLVLQFATGQDSDTALQNTGGQLLPNYQKDVQGQLRSVTKNSSASRSPLPLVSNAVNSRELNIFGCKQQPPKLQGEHNWGCHRGLPARGAPFRDTRQVFLW